MAERIQEIAAKTNFLVSDLDGTLVKNGVPHDEFGLLDGSQYTSIERKNITHLLNLAQKGLPVNIITARGISVTPLARFISNSLETDTTPDGRPVIFNLAQANGAFAVDLLRLNVICNEPIPMTFYQSLAEHSHLTNLMRHSTTPERFELTQRVTPDNLRSGMTGPIWDFALLYPGSIKVNLELSAQLINQNPEVKNYWEVLTGVRIKQQKDVHSALESLNSKHGWNLAIAGSNSQPTYDLSTETKYWCMLKFWDYTKELNSSYGVSSDEELKPMCLVDSPDGNDKTIAQIRGGVSVTKPKTKVGGYPIYFNEGESKIESTSYALELLEYSFDKRGN